MILCRVELEFIFNRNETKVLLSISHRSNSNNLKEIRKCGNFFSYRTIYEHKIIFIYNMNETWL